MFCARIVLDHSLLYQVVEHLEQFKALMFQVLYFAGAVWIFSDYLPWGGKLICAG